jgi:cyclopropane fatty-acyl-phospholipid synthase-like methyltransferase
MTDDSKALWLSIRTNLDHFNISLGRATAQAYVKDPRMLSFITSRYKFASKMLAGADLAIEIGCGDAFGAPIVAQSIKRLICTDIDEETIAQNRVRCDMFKNIEFHYHDFRAKPYPERARSIYLVDVIEHIFKQEETQFMTNLVNSLTPDGYVLMGTPNKAAEQYASQHSREGHINLKTQDTLRELLAHHFQNVFMFGMNDEVVHTGFAPMAQYIWGLGVGPLQQHV